LLRSRLSIQNRLFIGWFGPRGIGTLVLGLLVVERGQIQQESLITQVVAVTVTLSLVVHSVTAWPGIAWLGAREAADAPDPDEVPSEPALPEVEGG
jgi:NhaP-type Na+/H+ or K+/H+ antiporter